MSPKKSRNIFFQSVSLVIYIGLYKPAAAITFSVYFQYSRFQPLVGSIVTIFGLNANQVCNQLANPNIKTQISKIKTQNINNQVCNQPK